MFVQVFIYLISLVSVCQLSMVPWHGQAAHRYQMTSPVQDGLSHILDSGDASSIFIYCM